MIESSLLTDDIHQTANAIERRAGFPTRCIPDSDMYKYLIIIEKTDTGFSAYSPDLPGCVSTGKNRSEVKENMREATEFHLEGMLEEGYTIPVPSSESSYLEVVS